MFLLAIPMYAAPFVLVSLMSFVVFVAVPRLRRFAVAALVAPVAFGFCAIAGLIAWVFVGADVLKIEPGRISGAVFYVVPGVLGSWAAVWISNKALQLWGRLPIAPSWRERTSAAEAARSETV